jgi:hypothetical protein
MAARIAFARRFLELSDAELLSLVPPVLDANASLHIFVKASSSKF